MPLVLAGGKGWLMEDFRASQLLGLEADIVLTGYVSDDELVWLYRNCYANLYPSLFEGFGLPVLEGMQFGAATIASSATSIPEVAGDAAILLPPEDTEGWAQAMLGLAANGGEGAAACGCAGTGRAVRLEAQRRLRSSSSTRRQWLRQTVEAA